MPCKRRSKVFPQNTKPDSNIDTFATPCPSARALALISVVRGGKYGLRSLVALYDFYDATPDPLAFGLPKDSDLRGLINHNMVRLYQSGTLEYLKRVMMGQTGQPEDICSCRAVTSEEAQPLDFQVID